jgi:hypothetical protein
MVAINPKAWIGVGIYTVPEAAGYLHENGDDVRRWAFGYRRRRHGQDVEHPPLIHTQLPKVDGELAITFLELVELMYIRGFARAGASWKTIKVAAKTASRIFQTEHPFAMKRFFADPEGIYALIEETVGDDSLVELVGHGQHTLRDLVQPYLGQLDFDPKEVARRWWPLGCGGGVVLDPQIAFGAPIVAEVGIPTRALSSAFEAEVAAGRKAAIETVAWMYEVKPQHIEMSLSFRDWMRRSQSASSSMHISLAS